MAGPEDTDFNPYSAPASTGTETPSTPSGRPGVTRSDRLVILPPRARLPDDRCWRCGSTDGLSTLHFKLRWHPIGRRVALVLLFIFARILALFAFLYWHYVKGPFVHVDVPLCRTHRNRRPFQLIGGLVLLSSGCGLGMAASDAFGITALIFVGVAISLSGLVPWYFFSNLCTIRRWDAADVVDGLIGDEDGAGTSQLRGAGPEYLEHLPRSASPLL